MNFPDDRNYTKSHEWALDTGDGVYEVGITEYAATSMGELVYIDLPEEGDDVSQNEPFAEAESVKAVAEIMSPVTGSVTAANEELMDDASLANKDPYGAWFVKVEVEDAPEDLLSPQDYAAYVEGL